MDKKTYKDIEKRLGTPGKTKEEQVLSCTKYVTHERVRYTFTQELIDS